MTATQLHLEHYESLSDEALRMAFDASVSLYRGSRGRDRDYEYRLILLQREAAAKRGKPELCTVKQESK